MVSFPNCKINIGLNVLRRRSDGFHDIETVFCPVELSDILEFVITRQGTGNIILNVTGLPVDCNQDQNLCIKAYKLLSKDFSLPSINAHLHKIVPMGAGLGGGSSDAAFMLKMLSMQFKTGLSEERLCDYASLLGSDCAFFIKNRPLLGYGRGNNFREIGVLPGNIGVIIVHPGIHVSTAEAYAGIQPSIPSLRLENLITLPVEEWKGVIVNDFEHIIIQRHPVIGEIKVRLYAMGAVYASMTGSGSAVYGLFKGDAPSAGTAFPGMFSWKGQIRTSSATL